MNSSTTSTLLYLLVGYLCGVLFAPHLFSANIMHTQWLNIWTYAWLIFWPVMLVVHFIVPLFTGSVVIVKT